MSKSFRERNLTVIALVTVATLALAIVGSFQLAKIPFIAGSTYTAQFAEAGGLKSGDLVEVAGVEVGTVKSLGLDRGVVKVKFTAKGVVLGSTTTARIKTGSLLGSRFIALTPGGDTSDDTSVIPLSRTKAPYDLASSLSDITAHTQEIDLEKVSEAMDTFSETFRQSTEEVGPAIDGISALSQTIRSRDAQLRELFKKAESVTGTFRERTQQITSLISQGNLLLGELQTRRAAIERLIRDSSLVAAEVSGLVKDNEKQLKPALDELNSTLRLLRRNDKNITSAVERASTFIAGLGEGLAHGTWFAGHVSLAPGVASLDQFLPRVDDGQPAPKAER